MEKLLLFGMENSEEIRRLASNMKVKVIEVSVSQYHLTLEQILSEKTGDRSPQESVREELNNLGSLIVFCNLSEKHLDKWLFALRNKEIVVDYKAVLTDTNRKWNVKRLFAHMAMEKRRMQMHQ